MSKGGTVILEDIITYLKAGASHCSGLGNSLLRPLVFIFQQPLVDAMRRTQAKSQTCLRPAADQKDHSFSPDSVKVACVNLHLLRISYSDGQNVR